MREKIKLLIADASLVFRRAVEDAFDGSDTIQITGSVRNGEKAIELLEKNPPDIVTLDLNMPGMDGFQTLEEIKKFNASRPGLRPVGVIILSPEAEKGAESALRALEAGAFDLITKPGPDSLERLADHIKRQIILKARAWMFMDRAEKSRTVVSSSASSARPRTAGRLPGGKARAVFIGVSTGGPKALGDMLPSLCAKIDVPVFIVQHMPPLFTKSLASQLNSKCAPYKVLEGADGATVTGKTVFIAPGGMHMTVEKSGHALTVRTNTQPPENGCRPSVDTLFRSAASAYGASTVAVILTGMGSDGTNGASVMRDAGAHVIIQDEATSVIWGMPGSAAAAGCADETVPLMDIPEAVAKIVSGVRPRNGAGQARAEI
jgi:two-component system chemotaxis response regulator CheB